MTANDSNPFVERLQFFDGQRLFASDLQEIERFHRQMREMHNASLHQPGIGAGLAVAGSAGDREVVVGPGYALDLQGHEIVLTGEHREPVPPVEGDPDGTPAVYDLVVSYPEDDRLEVVETRAGVCAGRGAVRLREEPVFCWVRLRDDGTGVLRPTDPRLRDDMAVGRRIRLARAKVQHCELKELSIAERRNARPPVRPMIACGHADPAWTVTLPLGGDSPLAVLDAPVSTLSAGFVNTPCYSARLEGDRVLAATIDGEDATFFAEGLVNLYDPTPESFRVSVMVIASPPLPPTLRASPGDLFTGWTLQWMGVD